MRKSLVYIVLLILLASTADAQIDPALLRRVPKDTSALQINLDAVYNRPFLQVGKLPVALGGYAEANYQYIGEDASVNYICFIFHFQTYKIFE